MKCSSLSQIAAKPSFSLMITKGYHLLSPGYENQQTMKRYNNLIRKGTAPRPPRINRQG